MNPTLKDTTVQVVQDLDRAHALAERARRVLHGGDRLGDRAHALGDEMERIALERRKVSSMELRLAVVAPMKAGKSTLINAILGEELLPQRNAAMTTLPLEVFETTEVSGPELQVPPALLDAVREGQACLQRTLKDLSLEDASEILEKAGHPHLKDFPGEDGGRWPDESKVSGPGLSDALFYANDLFRVLSHLAPEANVLETLGEEDVLALAIPQRLGRSQGARVTYVDTPGPNEAGASPTLKAIVRQQLRKASLVLLVLDYQQLQSEAAAKMRKDVKEVVAARGEDALIVVVNKVDQRRSPRDMSREEVRSFVTSNLGLQRGSNLQLYETRAQDALIAQTYLTSLKSGLPAADARDQFIKAQQTTLQDLLRTLSPDDFTKHVGHHHWQDSGVPDLLDGALARMKAEAGPRVLQSATEVLRACCQLIHDDVDLRLRALQTEGHTIEEAKHELEARLKAQDEMRSSLRKRTAAVRKKLHEELFAQSVKLNSEIEGQLTTIFEISGRSSRKRTWEKLWCRLVPKDKAQNATYVEGGKVAKFPTKKQADEFARSARSEVRKQTLEVIRQHQGELRTQLLSVRSKIEEEVQDHSKEVIAEAQKQLGERLKVRLKLPRKVPTAKPGPLQFDSIRDERVIKGRDAEYKMRTKHLIDFNFFGLPIKLFKYEEQEKVRDKEKERKIIVHKVHLSKLQEQVNEWKDEFISQVQDGTTQWLDKELGRAVDRYLDGIDKYLRRYHQTLVKSLEDKQKTAVEQKALEDKLKSMNDELRELWDDLEDREQVIQTLRGEGT